MVTQLYTKDISGKYEKVNWNLLKVIPTYKIKKAINTIMTKERPEGEYVDGYRALNELIELLNIK